MKKILRLDNPRVWRTYQGGKLISKLHLKDEPDTSYPEEWIMSMTEAINPTYKKNEGLSHLIDENISLKSYIEKYPNETLGENHIKKYGLNTAVLVKFIDSLERLTLQVHPTKQDALTYFNSEYGKTECWYILGGRKVDENKPYVYIGFKEGVTRKLWEELFFKQDIPKMLECLNKIEVYPNDCILIEGGIPHAIGSGCFLIEIQEPTDYTIRVEKTTPFGLKIEDKLIHQGIGFEKMFELFNYQNFTEEELKNKYYIKPTRINKQEEILLGYDKIDYFKMTKIKTDKPYLSKEDAFYGLVVTKGVGKIEVLGETYPFKAGDQFFIPYHTKEINIKPQKEVELIKCFGPKV